MSADHIREAIENSLERLRTDYIDLYQIHWPERQTNFGKRGYVHSEDDDAISIKETLRALNHLLEEGLVKQIGISNETPWGVNEYLKNADGDISSRIVTIQNVYNLLSRQFEVGLAEMSIREEVGLLAYSPLAFGLLTGKYISGQYHEAQGCRFLKGLAGMEVINVNLQLKDYSQKVAEAHGLSLTQMSLAFVLNQPFVTSCLIGATTMQQLKENIDSIDIQLSDEVLRDISEIHDKYPDPAP